MQFNVGDIVSVAVIALMALKVAMRGFSYELSSKAGIFIGLLSALMFSSPVSVFLDSRYELGSYSTLVAMGVLFLLGYVAAKLLLSTLDELFEVLHLRFLDHILGFGLGAVEGIIIVSVVVYILQLQTMFDLEQITSVSTVIQRLEFIAPFSIDTVIREATF